MSNLTRIQSITEAALAAKAAEAAKKVAEEARAIAERDFQYWLSLAEKEAANGNRELHFDSRNRNHAYVEKVAELFRAEKFKIKCTNWTEGEDSEGYGGYIVWGYTVEW